MNKIVLIAVGLCGLLLELGRAAELGQPAAPLQVAEWVKGKPFTLAEVRGKQIVVVEFWATWCEPCRTSIPHLTALQKKFPDVLFVGLSEEKPEVVKKFVAQMGTEMEYAVAVDEGRATSAGYLKEFGVGGIPHAFVVDREGRVVWQGHPMAELEQTLTQLTAGKYDLAREQKRFAALRRMDEFFELVAKGGAEEKIVALGQELEAVDAELGGVRPGEKFRASEVRQLFKFQKLINDYQLAIQAGKEAIVLAGMKTELEKHAPKDFDLAAFFTRAELNRVFLNYYYAAAGQRNMDQLAQFAQDLGAIRTTNFLVLNEFAWVLLTDAKLKVRDAKLATQLAAAAVKASDGKVAGVLDTYARALFESGQVAEAISQQKQALTLAPTPAERRVILETLQRYEARAPQP